MKNLIAIFVAVILISLPVSADTAKQHNHDPALVGSWFATAADGGLTELTLERGGRFSLDQRSGRSAERNYMCGTWERATTAIDVEIRKQKEQLSNGEVVVADATSFGQFTLLKATGNTLILRIDNRVVAFHRNG